jgi:hypothetical protein
MPKHIVFFTSNVVAVMDNLHKAEVIQTQQDECFGEKVVTAH